MLHNKRGEAIPGTDVTHFFSLSPKVGQPRQEYCAFSRGEIDNGSPGAGFEPHSRSKVA